jgi:hypothetical protein
MESPMNIMFATLLISFTVNSRKKLDSLQSRARFL